MKTDEYILYSRDEHVGARLARWVDKELAAFRERYGTEVPRRGVIYAIEPEPEPFPAIESWAKKNVDRWGSAYWRKHSRECHYARHGGRPYCWRRWESPGGGVEDRLTPVIRESFAIPYGEASFIGLLDDRTPRPAWICFLTTDEHQKAANADLSREVTEDLARLGARPAPLPLQLFNKLYFLPKKRSIDRGLMHLQRREVLWTSILKSAGKAEGIPALIEEIGKAHHDLMVTKPVD